MDQVMATALPPDAPQSDPTDLPPKGDEQPSQQHPGDTPDPIPQPTETVPPLPEPTSSSSAVPKDPEPSGTEPDSPDDADSPDGQDEDDNQTTEQDYQETSDSVEDDSPGQTDSDNSSMSDTLSTDTSSTFKPNSSTLTLDDLFTSSGRSSSSSNIPSRVSRSSLSFGDISLAPEDPSASSGASLDGVESESSGLPLPAIIGIAGGVGLLLLGLLVLCCCLRKRKQKRMQEDAEAYEGIAWDKPDSRAGDDVHPEYYEQQPQSGYSQRSAFQQPSGHQQSSAYQQPSSYATGYARGQQQRTSIGSETAFYDDKTIAPTAITRFAAPSSYAQSIRTDGAEVQTQKAKSVAPSTLAPPRTATARSYAPSSRRSSMNSTTLYGPGRGGATSAVV